MLTRGANSVKAYSAWRDGDCPEAGAKMTSIKLIMWFFVLSGALRKMCAAPLTRTNKT